jgi:hypothetical protein
MKFLRRGFIAFDPIDFVPVAIEEKEERRPGNGKLPERGLAGKVASDRPIENEFVREKSAVFRIFIILLTQQEAAPSAARSEEIEEEKLPLAFCFGEGIIERAREPCDLGREN